MISLNRTAEQWRDSNPVLPFGKAGIETDTGRRKLGDGVSSWTALNYADADDKVIEGGSP